MTSDEIADLVRTFSENSLADVLEDADEEECQEVMRRIDDMCHDCTRSGPHGCGTNGSAGPCADWDRLNALWLRARRGADEIRDAAEEITVETDGRWAVI
jgi:hypothetical protein